MSLSLALNNALAGLNVNQVSIATASQNIANANTEGYSRLQTEQSAVILAGVGSGVQIDSITRKVDQYLERAIQRETTNLGTAEKIADYYQRIQILIGEPGQENSVDEYVGQFFNALQSLAETPDSTSFKAGAVDSAEILAREISGLAFALEDLRFQADQDIAIAVSALNTEIAHLETLNVAIHRAHALNDTTASLLDQRDQSLEKIAAFLDIDVNVQESGAVFVYTHNGRVPLIDTALHELEYFPAENAQSFVENAALRELRVTTIDEEGVEIGTSYTLFSEGFEDNVTSVLAGGELQGLQELRDTLIPDVLEQLDMLASRLRDEVNALHNQGTGFPAADELTGTRLVAAHESFDWSGAATISILDESGAPVVSTYGDEPYGYRALNLDFSTLDGGDGAGTPDVQTILDEINNHFNAPPVKAQVGNLNNVQLAMTQDRIPNGGAPASISFDLDLDNLSGFEAETWVTAVTITDDAGAVVSSTAAGTVSDTVPRLAVDEPNAYTFTASSSDVVITTQDGHGLTVGERIFLENPFAVPTGALGGGSVSDSDVSGYFEVVDIPGDNQFTIRMVAAVANATVVDNAGGNAFDALPPYQEVAAGDKMRTRDSGIITADVSANTAAPFYDITIDIGVYDNDQDNPNTQDSAISDTASITFRIFNNQTDLLNRRLDAQDIPSNSGVLVFPDTPHQYIIAQLVDENGDELTVNNGNYGRQSGYIQLVANDINGKDVTIAIDEGTSRQLGRPNENPVEEGTNRQFSHYFELNNFFVSNEPTLTGDTDTNSAINLAVEQRVLDDPRLISTGNLEATPQPTDPDATPRYTLSRFPGDNSLAQSLAGLALQQVSFDTAGGLPNTSLTFNGYSGEIIGFLSNKTVLAEANYSDTEILYNGLTSRADAISGVNLDEELAQTTLYQQAYTASARAFTITNELFGELLNIV